ncbi:sugar ABC transporter substrate-binding protein [Treponema sp. OMZ 840]|uniref:sugar ABC transporter substrate-binding protein n=1 Tax=Treponema sp. OMZ 840 TaxID=244313 RepID=UPI003D9460F0
MKKLLVLLMAACICLVAFAGGEKEKNGAGAPFIGLAMHNQTETWAVQFKNTFVEYAKAKGCKVTVTDANKDVSNQVGQIEDLVSLGIDSLVVLPADYTALGQALKTAYNAGVKIVDADSKVVEDDQKFISCFITADCYSGGYAIGKYLSNKLVRNAKIGALNYPQLSVIAVRFDGLAAALKDAGRSDVTIINKDCTDLSAISSYTEDMLMANPDISAFVCLNDNTALSCASTCGQMGKKNIMVFGFDGSPAAKQAIAAGEMTGSGVYSPIDLAKAAVDAVISIIRGESYERETLVNMWLIDPDNIKKMDLKNWS